MIRNLEMTRLPRSEWPLFTALETEPLDVWVSSEFMAVLYRQRADGNRRLTVNRMRRNNRGDFRDGITWDELQRVKNECLGPDVWCVENYPSEEKLMNVCNQRHLFIFDGTPDLRFPDEAVVSDDDVNAVLDLYRKMLGKGA